MLRTLLALIVLPLLLVSAGCTASSKVDGFADLRIRHDGKPQDPKLWETVDKIREESPERSLTQSSSTNWLLPGFVQVKNFAIASDSEQARSIKFSWNDLSSPLLVTFLPLRISYREYHYNREQERPIASRSLNWNLFWASSNSRGEISDAVRLKSVGIPLLYSHTRLERKENNTSIRFYNSLWTFGPALMKFNGEGPEGPGEGYLATPLLLGGILGIVLWTDYNLKNDRAQITGHGPLGGLLGYWRIKERFLNEELAQQRPPMDGRVVRERGSRFLLGGLLWHDFHFRDGEGKTIRSGNGPLWSAFGWGRKDNRFAPRLFFISI